MKKNTVDDFSSTCFEFVRLQTGIFGSREPLGSLLSRYL